MLRPIARRGDEGSCFKEGAMRSIDEVASMWKWHSVSSTLARLPDAGKVLEDALLNPGIDQSKRIAAVFASNNCDEFARLCNGIRSRYSILSVTDPQPDSHLLQESQTCSLDGECPADDSFDDGRWVLPDGRILNWTWGNYYQLWDTSSNPPTAITFQGHKDRINGVCYLTNHYLLSWSDDGTLRLWNISDTSNISATVLEGHEGPVRGANLLPDGRVLSWSDDATLRFWKHEDVGSFSCERCAGHTGPVLEVTLLTDGRIRSKSHNETIIWG